MGECEVCGKAVSNLRRADIDGVILEVCENCVKLGKEISEPGRVVLGRKTIETLEEGEELAADFAEKVRKARESRDLKQDDAAKRMGISPSVLKRIENGFRPDEGTAKKIQRFYGISLYRKE